MAAAKTSTPSPSTSSLLKTLKAGALLPARNRSLFAAVFALAVAYTSLLLLVNDLAVQPRADKLLLDAMATFHSNGTGPTTTRSPDEYAQLLLQGLRSDAWDLARASAASLLLDATAGSAVWIVALLAAVVTCSGETTPSLGALLRKARARLMGPALTAAFVYALQIAYAALLLAAIAALLVKGPKPNPLLLPGWLLLASAAAVFHVYLTFLCALGVVVAAAEPGRPGAGAVAQAWRLAKGRKRREALLVAVVGALAAGCSRMHALARACSPASRLLLGFLYAAAMAAVKLFAVCAITVFCYECREESDDDAANTEFVKLASEELIGV